MPAGLSGDWPPNSASNRSRNAPERGADRRYEKEPHQLLFTIRPAFLKGAEDSSSSDIGRCLRAAAFLFLLNFWKCTNVVGHTLTN